ncbi:MAG TPA: YafY family protein [Solirubrobacteraceae bacterium]|jgi:predicted DNA-binding transcriptional regulator YafY|nr:YafY family protein [Solirubrobacteraceae bacterium]
MIETSARLLRLLSLLQARRDWSGGELADRLEVGVRTVRRDVDRLRRLGYPIAATPGVAGGYRLGAGSTVPPLLLDAEEAVAVAVGLRTAATVGVAGIEETSIRALAKLEHLLPPGLRRRVSALGAATVPYTSGGPTVDAELLAQIATACRDHERIRFAYRSHSGESTRRLVEPHRLVHTGRRWYLVAWDVDRADWRTFRVDRLGPRVSVDRRFSPREPPAEDIAAYVSRAVSSTRDRYQATVILRAPVAQVAGRVPTWVGTLEAIDDDSCLLRTGSDWLGGLAVYVADIGVDFEVLEPPEFVDRVRQLADRFRRAVPDDPSSPANA